MPVLTGPELDDRLADILGRLRAVLTPVAVYLYGSYAYGTPAPHSDIDLLVVVADSPLDPYERDAAAYRALSEISVPVDVQVYTRAEFEERAALPVSFERTVKRKGKLIHAA
jgi:predicted nucleotidyltransferase